MRLADYIILGVLLLMSICILQIRDNAYKITEVNNIRLDGITVRQAIMVEKILNACRDGKDERILKEVEKYIDTKERFK